MKEFSVVMSIVDYVPVLLFLAAALILQFDLYGKMRRYTYGLFSAGVVSVTLAGALKATYKLLYALGICDFEALSNLFFPLQALGFLMAGTAMVLMLAHPKRAALSVAAAPALYSGTFLFVGLMVLGLAGTDAVLCVLAKKQKKPRAMIYFIISFVMCLMMGYLSSRDFDKAIFNWIAEVINIAGQGTLLWGVLTLHFGGLKDLKLRGKPEETQA